MGVSCGEFVSCCWTLRPSTFFKKKEISPRKFELWTWATQCDAWFSSKNYLILERGFEYDQALPALAAPIPHCLLAWKGEGVEKADFMRQWTWKHNLFGRLPAANNQLKEERFNSESQKLQVHWLFSSCTDWQWGIFWSYLWAFTKRPSLTCTTLIPLFHSEFYLRFTSTDLWCLDFTCGTDILLFPLVQWK